MLNHPGTEAKSDMSGSLESENLWGKLKIWLKHVKRESSQDDQKNPTENYYVFLIGAQGPQIIRKFFCDKEVVEDRKSAVKIVEVE